MQFRFRALVEYDGTAYCGFQRQLAQPSIQGELEQAILAVTGQPATVIGAGRTDSGVHALGQVIAFDLSWKHGPDTLLRAMNANLPQEIAVNRLEVADKNFHPRYDATRRAYEYHIYNRPVRSPLRHTRSWHVPRPLDEQAMNQAAATLIGVRDFATFGQPPQGENTVREIFRAYWDRQEELLIFHIEANAFLFRMVRSLVGTMKVLGEGSWTVSDFMGALAACDRRRAGQTAPPQGLFLVSVNYD
jgi:tRNA pseudouridine38-40 synthase